MSNSLKRLKSVGFTIVELLVVIVVIGILVAVSVVTYNGVQKIALDKAVLSDVEGVSGEVARNGTKNQGMINSAVTWYSPYGANPNIYFTLSSGTVIYVEIINNDYCIRGYNTASKTYTSLTYPAIKESLPGICAYVGMGVATTLAGSGVIGSANGIGTAAQFSGPRGVAVDSSGTIYVADADNHQIRKITAAGVVTTLAGSGTAGSANGTGIAAQFTTPYGVAVDSSGTIYVADTFNNLIRKITAAGVVTTLAGSGAVGSANGTGTAAQFNNPRGIAVDSLGTVYVADTSNHQIRKITAAGVVTTLAGSTYGSTNGTGIGAQFAYPYGIAVDSSGKVYVGDSQNNLIRKITAAGVVTTLAGGSRFGGSANGIGGTAQFAYPMGVAVDSSGTVYVADYYNYSIRKITPAGAVTTPAGLAPGFADATGIVAKFAAPVGVAVDSSGTIYVADSDNNRIRKIQ